MLQRVRGARKARRRVIGAGQVIQLRRHHRRQPVGHDHHAQPVLQRGALHAVRRAADLPPCIGLDRGRRRGRGARLRHRAQTQYGTQRGPAFHHRHKLTPDRRGEKLTDQAHSRQMPLVHVLFVRYGPAVRRNGSGPDAGNDKRLGADPRIFHPAAGGDRFAAGALAPAPPPGSRCWSHRCAWPWERASARCWVPLSATAPSGPLWAPPWASHWTRSPAASDRHDFGRNRKPPPTISFGVAVHSQGGPNGHRKNPA